MEIFQVEIRNYAQIYHRHYLLIRHLHQNYGKRQVHSGVDFFLLMRVHFQNSPQTLHQNHFLPHSCDEDAENYFESFLVEPVYQQLPGVFLEANLLQRYELLHIAVWRQQQQKLISKKANIKASYDFSQYLQILLHQPNGVSNENAAVHEQQYLLNHLPASYIAESAITIVRKIFTNHNLHQKELKVSYFFHRCESIFFLCVAAVQHTREFSIRYGHSPYKDRCSKEHESLMSLGQNQDQIITYLLKTGLQIELIPKLTLPTYSGLGFNYNLRGRLQGLGLKIWKARGWVA